MSWTSKPKDGVTSQLLVWEFPAWSAVDWEWWLWIECHLSCPARRWPRSAAPRTSCPPPSPAPWNSRLPAEPCATRNPPSRRSACIDPFPRIDRFPALPGGGKAGGNPSVFIAALTSDKEFFLCGVSVPRGGSSVPAQPRTRDVCDKGGGCFHLERRGQCWLCHLWAEGQSTGTWGAGAAPAESNKNPEEGRLILSPVLSLRKLKEEVLIGIILYFFNSECGWFFPNFPFSRVKSSAFTAFQFLVFLLNPGMERYQMYSQSLGDVLNKWLFKGRCYPVLPLNIPWDLES